MRDAEYDRFGPWILEISARDPLPRIFAEGHIRKEPPLLAMKVPRPIDRSQAWPGMDLYDYVVHLYDQDLEIARRSGTTVVRETCRYTDIVSIALKEVLLKGAVTLHLPRTTYSFEYSTVSSDLIMRMVGLIRERYTSADTLCTIQGTSPARSLEALGHYYFNVIREFQTMHPDHHLLAHQPRTPLSSVDSGRGRRLLHRVAAKVLLESLHLTDGRELCIIKRDRDFSYLRRPVYGKEQWFIPLRNVRQIQVDEDSAHTELTPVHISTDASCCSVWVLAGNPLVERYGSMSGLLGI